jgi:hypothetical protein
VQEILEKKCLPPFYLTHIKKSKTASLSPAHFKIALSRTLGCYKTCLSHISLLNDGGPTSRRTIPEPLKSKLSELPRPTPFARDRALSTHILYALHELQRRKNDGC